MAELRRPLAFRFNPASPPSTPSYRAFPLPANRLPWLLRGRYRAARWALVALLTLAGLIARYNVDDGLTDDDRFYIRRLLPGVAEGCAPRLPYQAQLALVGRSQRVLRTWVRAYTGIPQGQPREPRQVLLGHAGLCYDRSRVLEKMFTYLGLATRHVALFELEPGINPLKTLLFDRVSSHAVSEVLTRRGWLLVDSNDPWLGLDQHDNPVTVSWITACYAQHRPVRWLRPAPARDAAFYGCSCLYVYGLYSRHGRFFPPYTAYIPDYNVRELLYNF